MGIPFGGVAHDSGIALVTTASRDVDAGGRPFRDRESLADIGVQRSHEIVVVEQSLKLHLLTPYLARDVQFDTSVVSVNLPKAKDTFAEILVVVIGKLLSFDKCIAEEFIHDRTNVVCIHFPSRTRKKNILKFDPIELRKRSNLVPHQFPKLELHIA